MPGWFTRTLVLATSVLGGCHLVFGLDEVVLEPDATIPPAERVTGRYLTRTVVNTALGEPMIVDVPFTPGLVTMSAATDLGATPIEQHVDGTFELSVPIGKSYRVVIERGDDVLEIQTAARHLELGRFELGRPGRTLITQPSALQITMTPASNVGFASVATTGVWASTQWTAGTAPLSNYKLDWATAPTPRGDLPALFDGTKNDRIYYSRSELFDLDPTVAVNEPGFALVRYVENSTLVQRHGMQTDFVGTTGIAPSNRCIHAVADRPGELARLSAAWPFQSSVVLLGWQLVATSAPTFTTTNAFMLAGYVDTVATRPKLDHDVRYGNIFPGTSVALKLTTILQRPIRIGNALEAAVLAVTDYTVPVPVTPDCMVRAEIPNTVPIPTHAVLGGTALSSDHIGIELDRQHRIPLTWDAGSGEVDLYYAVLAEVEDVANQTTVRPLRTFYATTPNITIDPSLFVVGRTYMFVMGHNAGASGPSAGDFTGVHPADASTAAIQVASSTFQIGN